MTLHRSLVLLPLAVLALGGCASSAIRYTDDRGQEYTGTLDPATNSQTAQIDGKLYRGPYKVNEWSQAKSTLARPTDDKLYCEFYYQVLKVKGTCADLAGREYRMQSR